MINLEEIKTQIYQIENQTFDLKKLAEVVSIEGALAEPQFGEFLKLYDWEHLKIQQQQRSQNHELSKSNPIRFNEFFCAAKIAANARVIYSSTLDFWCDDRIKDIERIRSEPLYKLAFEGKPLNDAYVSQIKTLEALSKNPAYRELINSIRKMDSPV